MICKECNYYDYVIFDGHYCNWAKAFIPEKLVSEDIDCMVLDSNDVNLYIGLDEDGCKNIKATLISYKDMVL